MSSDLPRERIRQLTLEDGNRVCADCGESGPEWASINLGVFVCIDCAGVHRRMSTSVSKVRSVRLDTWTEEMVENMATHGNMKAKKKWEANVPPCWVPPTPTHRHVCREQWIRAKYERQEFIAEVDEVKRPYTTGILQGFLMKKKKQPDSREWNRRWFVLSHEYLAYFKSFQDRTPKGLIRLVNLNVTLNGPGLDDHPNSMLIVYRDDRAGKTRNIFVYADNGKEIMDWCCAIRTAKIKLMQETFPDHSLEELQKKATRDFVLTGYLCKMPPSQAKFQKRLFVLDQNCLRYYSSPRDPHPLGEILLGSNSEGYWVDENVQEKLQQYNHVFMLHVPNRPGGGFPLLAEDPAAKKEWIEALQHVIQNARGSPDLCLAQVTYEDDDSAPECSACNFGMNGLPSPPTSP